MSLLEQEVLESNSGFTKELEESALSLIFDTLQKSQYQFPIKSTVREITCNALDSVKEKKAALEIIKGTAKEEDYFIHRDDAIYKDSNFDPSYYDPKWLSDNNIVTITYHSEETTGSKDYISIKDYGVGLGNKRMEGYFKVGYSTKRNSKLTIGRFGQGAKAPLATLVPSYRTIVTYNGAKFIFDIFSHKVDSAIPRLNLITGKKNKSYKFTNGYQAYYEETTEKNSVEVIIETKKHHKQQYIDAIKSQLLYLNGFEFYIEENGMRNLQSVHSDILYEDDKLILANNYQYSKPHIVIDGVTYGYIQFLELELENKVGNIGIKVGNEEVSVNPSRETVIWDDKTRDTIVNRFHEAVDIATNIVSKELQETNFIKWVEKCIYTLSHTNSNSLIGRLSSIVDKDKISPSFPGDPAIKYRDLKKFFTGFKVRVITKITESGKSKIKRVNAETWSGISFKNLYLQTELTKHNKDVYLYSIVNGDNTYYSQELITVIEPLEAPTDSKLTPKQLSDYKAYQDKILKQLESTVSNYEEVEIPEDWKNKIEKLIENEEVEEIKVTISPAERRKLNQSTVYREPYKRDSWAKEIGFTIKEWKISTINNFDDQAVTVVYGFQEDRALLEVLYTIGDTINVSGNLYKIIAIAKENEKHYINLKSSFYVKDLFKQINTKDKSISVGELLIKYNTKRKIEQELEDMDFLKGFSGIDVEVFESYKELKQYCKGESSNSMLRYNTQVFNEVNEFLDKITEFQLFVTETEGNKELVKNKSKELFGHENFQDAIALDMDIFEKYKTISSYVEPLKTLLSSIEVLSGDSKNISSDLETEIKHYVNWKLNLE